MTAVKPPTQPPEMSKGTLLLLAKKTDVFSKPLQNPSKRSEKYVGSVKKGTRVMSLGEFVSTGKKTWVKVLTEKGSGWIRVGSIARESPV